MDIILTRELFDETQDSFTRDLTGCSNVMLFFNSLLHTGFGNYIEFDMNVRQSVDIHWEESQESPFK